MIWLALLAAFAAGLNVSLAVWELSGRNYGQVTWRVMWTVVCGSLAVYCATGVAS